MIADAHLHLFRHGFGPSQGAPILRGMAEVDAYERLMARYGIEAGLVVCYEADGIDPDNNAYVRELATTRPWIASVAFLSPHPVPSVDAVEALIAAGHCGIAVYLPDAATADAVLSWPRDIWERLGRARAIVSLNARPEAIAALQPLTERFPRCEFLFSHLGLPGRWGRIPVPAEARQRLDPLLRLAHLPNVGVKISGLYAVDPVPPHRFATPFVDLLLETFEPQNLHWGSDFSPALEFVAFEDTLPEPKLRALPPHQRELIMGGGLAAKSERAKAASDAKAIDR